MREATLTAGQQRLLDRYKEAGGVVEYVVLEGDGSLEMSTEQTHHAATVAGLQVIQKRTDAWAESDLEKAGEIVGERINHEEFLGPRYDFQRRGLIVRGKGTFLNEFFFNSDDPTPNNIVSSDKIDNGIGVGYAYAFSSPPYGVRVSAEEIAELFEKVNSFILGSIDSKSVIYRWPTDWSNYFEAGDEWWGSFLWTFANPGRPQIVVLAASTTD